MRAALFPVVAVLLIALQASGGATPSPQHAAAPAPGLACRALEVHTDAARHVTAIVFHHAAEASREPLATLLREHPGAVVDIDPDGKSGWAVHGAVFRLKSCFGRGLLLLPESSSMKEGTVFRLRLSAP